MIRWMTKYPHLGHLLTEITESPTAGELKWEHSTCYTVRGIYTDKDGKEDQVAISHFYNSREAQIYADAVTHSFGYGLWHGVGGWSSRDGLSAKIIKSDKNI